jgi:hypothetical protein
MKISGEFLGAGTQQETFARQGRVARVGGRA